MSIRTILLTSAALLPALPAAAEMNFNRIASFAVIRNMAEGEDGSRESSAEIIAATGDGLTLVYTDSPLGVVGRIDITDPKAPQPLGNVAMDGEPTSVAVLDRTAFVAVNTSESYTAPSGKLVTLDVATGAVGPECDLGGQPDSVALAPDGSFLAVAIENERDEEAGDGRVPQMPPGHVSILAVRDGAVDCGSLVRADLTGLATIAPEDPEPEFLDINGKGEIVVTLQENNHVAVIDKAGKVMSHFPAGSVDLDGIDATDERGALIFTESQPGRLREPDAVRWIGDDLLVTANEGDMDGGARGFTVFARDGSVVHESGAAFERAVVEIGHYPDKRSDAKGVEPEGVAVASFGGTPMMFLMSERGSVVGVYDISDPARPLLRQLLPSGIAPEGAVAIPARNLLVTANEADLGADGGARSHVMIYEYQEAPAAYPTITSAGTEELIGWGALSGLAADPEVPGRLHAVNDSFYGFQPTIFTLDATQKPARISGAIRITRAGQPAQKLDIEGIASDGEGGFWLASEGRTDRVTPHAIYHVNEKGEIKAEIGLPAELLAGETRFGFEGITLAGGKLWMAVQREWGDDPKGEVKLVAYDPEGESWSAVRYPLDPMGEGWNGLSEITARGDWVYVVERDNLVGDAAVTKKLYRVPMSDMQGAALGGALPVVRKELVRDLLPDLKAWNGFVAEKVEGFAIDAAGEGFVVTDNDGVDDSSGETFFWSLGKLAD